MADESEVIHGQMEHTRKDLADKIEKLEQKISGTVDTVSGTVSTVTDTVETVKDSIAETVHKVSDTVQHTVEAVTGSVGSTVETVKESMRGFFDVPRHVQNHPWLMFGGSVLVGYLGGRLLLPRTSRDALAGMTKSAATSAPALSSQTAGSSYIPTPEQPARQERRSEPRDAGGTAREGWFSRLAGQLSPQLNHLKGLALGTAFGALRDMITNWVPENLRKDVTDVINGFTSDLGGQVIREPVLGGTDRGDGHGAGQPSHGART